MAMTIADWERVLVTANDLPYDGFYRRHDYDDGTTSFGWLDASGAGDAITDPQPTEEVDAVVAECIRKGVHAEIVGSGGSARIAVGEAPLVV